VDIGLTAVHADLRASFHVELLLEQMADRRLLFMLLASRLCGGFFNRGTLQLTGTTITRNTVSDASGIFNGPSGTVAFLVPTSITRRTSANAPPTARRRLRPSLRRADHEARSSELSGGRSGS
jgi:hypothetical protein